MTIEYKEAVVTYIDILGFSDLVSNKSPGAIHNVLKYFGETTQEVPRDAYVAIENDAFALWHEITNLRSTQQKLMEQHLLIRGGMTVGSILVDSGTGEIFGPALVNSYNAESKLSRVPRIVISDETIQRFAGVWMIESLITNKIIKQDEENDAWINYFNSYLLDRYSPRDLWEFYDEIARPIIGPEISKAKNQKEAIEFCCRNSPREAANKYWWLMTQHNQRVDTLSKHVNQMPSPAYSPDSIKRCFIDIDKLKTTRTPALSDLEINYANTNS